MARVEMDPKVEFNERRVLAWIGRAIRVEGKVISTEDLTIDGQVEGSIELGDHSLTIGTGAIIKADLQARIVTISSVAVRSIVLRPSRASAVPLRIRRNLGKLAMSRA